MQAVETHDGILSYRTFESIKTNGPGLTATINVTAWKRTTDEAQLENLIHSSGQTPTGNFTSSTDSVYASPCPDLQWPLAVGAVWQETCTRHTTRSGSNQTSTQTMLTNYTVQAQENVTVPAGTFTAYRIQIETGGQTDLEWYSATACGIIKSRAENDSDSTATLLTSYSC